MGNDRLRCSMFRAYSDGYTLLEVLLALSIMMLLTLQATENFYPLYHRVKMQICAHQIMSEIGLARSTAIARQMPVTYSANPSWKQQREIRLVNGALIHSFAAPLPAWLTLDLRNSLGKNKQILFLPLGFTQEQRGSFYLCSEAECLRIIINVSGLVHCDI